MPPAEERVPCKMRLFDYPRTFIPMSGDGIEILFHLVFRLNHTIQQQGAVGWVEHARNPSERPQEMGFSALDPSYRVTTTTGLLQGDRGESPEWIYALAG